MSITGCINCSQPYLLVPNPCQTGGSGRAAFCHVPWGCCSLCASEDALTPPAPPTGEEMPFCSGAGLIPRRQPSRCCFSWSQPGRGSSAARLAGAPLAAAAGGQRGRPRPGGGAARRRVAPRGAASMVPVSDR